MFKYKDFTILLNIIENDIIMCYSYFSIFIHVLKYEIDTYIKMRIKIHKLYKELGFKGASRRSFISIVNMFY